MAPFANSQSTATRPVGRKKRFSSFAKSGIRELHHAIELGLRPRCHSSVLPKDDVTRQADLCPMNVCHLKLSPRMALPISDEHALFADSLGATAPCRI